MFKTYTASQDFSLVPKEELEAAHARFQLEADALRAQIQERTDKLMQLVEDQKAIREVQDTRHLEGRTSGEDWAFLLENGSASSKTRYEAGNKALEELMGRKHGLALAFSGYNPETGQRNLRISLERSKPELTRRVHAALEQLLPFVKKTDPATSERPGAFAYKFVDIMEASLSANGSYFLVIDEDVGRYEVYRSRLSASGLVHTASSLMNLLTYVQEHLPYSDESDI